MLSPFLFRGIFKVNRQFGDRGLHWRPIVFGQPSMLPQEFRSSNEIGDWKIGVLSKVSE